MLISGGRCDSQQLSRVQCTRHSVASHLGSRAAAAIIRFNAPARTVLGTSWPRISEFLARVQTRQPPNRERGQPQLSAYRCRPLWVSARLCALCQAGSVLGLPRSGASGAAPRPVWARSRLCLSRRSGHHGLAPAIARAGEGCGGAEEFARGAAAAVSCCKCCRACGRQRRACAACRMARCCGRRIPTAPPPERGPPQHRHLSMRRRHGDSGAAPVVVGAGERALSRG